MRNQNKIGSALLRIFSRTRILFSVISAAALLSSCKGTVAVDPGLGGSGSGAGSISIVAGNNQSGTVNTDLAVPFTVLVKDSSGSPAVGMNIDWTITSGGGTLSAESTQTGNAGTSAVSFHLPGVTGTQTVTAKLRGADSSMMVTFSSSSSPTPNVMTVTLSSTTVTAGVPVTATVKVADQYGHTRSDYLGVVTLSAGDAQAVLPASYQFTSGATGGFDNGVHTFSIIYKTVGTYAFTVSDPTNGLSQGVSVRVGPATASSLSISNNVPSSATVKAGASIPSVTVKAVDPFGNIDTFSSLILTATVQDSNGSPVPVFGGSNVFSPSSGVYTISGLQVHQSGTGLSLKLQASPLPEVISNSFDVTPGNATSLNLVSGSGLSGVIGSTLSQPIVASLSDTYGNPVNGATLAWSVSSGTLNSTSLVTDATGKASNQFTFPQSAGVVNGTVSFGALQKTFTETAIPDVPTSIVVISGNAQAPANIGTALQPFVIEVRDHAGNPVPNSTIDWTLTSGSGVLSPSASTTSSVSGTGYGQASSTLTLSNTAGSVGVQAKIRGTAITQSFSASAKAGTAANFVIVSGDSQSGQVGTALASPLTVQVTDSFANPISGATINWSVTTGTATLASSQTQTGSDGKASNTVQLPNSTGLQTIRAALGGSALPALTFSLTADPANSVGSLVLTVPATATAGQSITANLTVRDTLGNTKTNFSGAVSLTSSDPAFSPVTNYVFTTGSGGDNGTRDFSIVLSSAGLQSLMASAAGLTQQKTVTVSAAPATQLIWTTDLNSGSNYQAGQSLPSVTVKAVDAFGNTDKNYTANVALILNPNPGAASFITPSAATVAAVQGAAVFSNLALDKVGASYQLAASGGLASNSLNPTGASSHAFNIVAGTPTQMAIQGGSGQAGSAGTTLSSALQVILRDQFLNPVGSIPVVWTSSSGGTFTPSGTINTDTTGVSSATYSLPTTAGAVNVTASYYGATTLTQTFALQADAGPATQLSIISGNNASGSAGSNLPSLVISVLDQFNNLKSGAQIDWSSADGVKFSGSSTTSTTSGSDGRTSVIATLPVSVGSNSVSATIHGLSPTVSKTFSLTTYAGTPSSIEIVSGDNQSGYVGNQVTNPLIVVVKDVSGNPVPNASVDWTQSAGTLVSSVLTTDANGRAQTGLLLPNSTGTLTVDATVHGTSIHLAAPFSANATPSATLGSLSVTAASTSTAGQSINITVTAKDTLNNTKTNFTGSVSLSSNDAQVDFGIPSSGPCPAPCSSYTFTQGAGGDNGAHVFNITFKTKGTATLTFDGGSGVTKTISVTVSPAGATQLVLAADLPATSYTAATTLPSLTVRALDPYNNLDTNFTRAIAVALNPNPGSASLGGTTSTPAVGGLATFSNLSITKAALGYQLKFTATNASSVALTPTTSQAFDITAGVPTSIVAVSGYTTQGTVGTSIGTLSAQVFDASSNPVPNISIAWTSNAGGSFSPATSSTTDSTGTGSTSFTLPTTAGNLSVTATYFGTSTLTANFAITAKGGAAETFTVTGFNSPSTAGVQHSVTVTAKDHYGNTATGYSGTVKITSSDVQSVLPANSTLTNNTGTFNVTLKTVGTQSITATDTVTSSITGTQTGVSVTPAGASSFTVAGFSSSPTAGVASSFTVTALDPFGNTDTNYAGTIHFTSSDGQAVLPSNTTLTSGTKTLLATLKTVGTQSITATDTVASSINGSQGSIVVGNGTATKFVVSGFPTSPNAGSTSSVTVTAKDAFGNIDTGYSGTVHMGSSDPQAVLGADSTISGGTGTFSVTLKTAGTRSITATDTGDSSITGSQTSITVNAISATTLSVSGFPSSSSAGASGKTITVVALDPYGNTDTSFNDTVKFTSSDAQAVLPADSKITGGSRSFSVTLKTAGTQSIVATDKVTNSINGSQTGLSVVALPASVIQVSGFSTPSTAGVAGSFTVTALDTYNNVDTSYSGTLHFTSTDGNASLPVNSTLTNGTKTFLATLKTAGTHSITATDTVTSSLTGSQSSISISAASATIFVVNGFGTTVSAGTAGSVTVTAKDPYGNTDAGYTGTVHLTSSDSQAALAADGNLSAGSKSFAVTLKTAGTRSITATDTVTPSITGSQTGILVNPISATKLILTGFSSAPNAGASGTITVTASDPYGNTDVNYTGSIKFTSTDAQATLPSDTTFTGAMAGTKNFSATLFTSGTQSITATDKATSSINGSQSGIVVAPLGVTKLVVSGFPTSTVTYVGGSVTVKAEDTYNNVVPTYAGTIHFTSSDAQAQLPSNTTLTSGSGTFPVTFQNPGTQSITATDTVTGSITGTQSGISVAAGTAKSFTVTGFPTTPTAGVASNITVTALDLYGATATGYTGTVHLTSTDAQATLAADATLTNGVGTFSVTLKTVGAQTITAADSVTSSIKGTQSGITVGVAALNKAVYTTAPITSLQTSMPLNPVIQAEDQFGNFISSALSTSLAVYTESTCTTAASGGTLAVTSGSTNSSGQWAPTGVKYSAVGSFWLGASITGAANKACAPFTTTAATPSLVNSTVTATAGSAVAGSTSIPIAVVVRDSQSNPIQGMTVSITSSPIGSVSSAQVTDASGLASFSVTSLAVGRALVTATAGSTTLSQNPAIYFLQALPIADFTAPTAQSNLSPGTNSPSTSTWTNRNGNTSYDGHLNGFGYTTSSGWNGNGGTSGITDPYQLVFDGSTQSSVDFGQSANAGGLVEAFVRMPASLGSSSRGRVLMTNADSSGYGFTLRHSRLGATQIAASSAPPLELVGGSAAYEDTILADSPLAYWPSPSSDFKDQVNSNHLTTSGTFGTMNYADWNYYAGVGPYIDSTSPGPVALNGTTQRFLSGGYSYTGNVSTSTDLTVEAWTTLIPTTHINSHGYNYKACAPYDPNFHNEWGNCATRGTATDSDPAPIIAKHDGTTGMQWAVYWKGGKIVWQMGSNTLTSTALSLNTWYHVAVTQTNAGVATLYINGTANATASFSSFTMTDSNSPIYIGYDSTLRAGTAAYAMGNITHVAVYSSALSSSRIAAHYSASANQACELGNLPQTSSWNYVYAWASGTTAIRAGITTKTAASTAAQICSVTVPVLGGATNAFNSSSGNLVFGADRTKSANYFTGALGELRVFPYNSGSMPQLPNIWMGFSSHYNGEKATYP